MKKILAAMCAAITLTLTGCSLGGAQTYNVMNEYNFSEMTLVQLEAPENGDPIAIFDTSMGEIRAVLYPEYAPNYVAAFTEKVQSGYYDGLEVYGLLDDIYFLTGAEKNADGNYIGRQTDDELIANECNVNLWPFKGALVAFSEKPGYSDSRFFIVNTDKETLTEDGIKALKDSVADRENETERNNLLSLFDKFYEIGGAFGASGTYPVFGQTYEGIDVIEKICAVPTDENNVPQQKIVINSVKIDTFKAEE